MQDDDYIARAKAKAAEWKAMQAEAWQESRFDGYSASELIKLAETGNDLDGRKLTSHDLYALHGAWFAKFGEEFGRPAGSPKGPCPKPERPLGEHPLFAVPDDQMLRPRDVIRLCGIPRTTLKRWRKQGHMPQPQRLSPHAKHVGWPARQVKAWLRFAQTGDVAGNG